MVYVPGNHDEMFRAWLGLEIAGVRLAAEAVHEAADGKRYLVIHGDEFDGVVANARFLAALGDRAYRCALVVNRWFNAVRYRLGYPYWSLSQWLKQSVKSAVKRVEKFEEALVLEARRKGSRRRHLRPYPQGRDPGCERHPVHERRGLGRKLHGAGRACGRRHGAGALGAGELSVLPSGGIHTGIGPGLRVGADDHPLLPEEARLSRILIISDAWRPQVNGVVRTLETVSEHLKRDGCAVEVIGPDRFRSVPLPSYPEIRLALGGRAQLARLMQDFAPDSVHIATEGPLGWQARALCRQWGWNFTTSFHTRFPDYLRPHPHSPRLGLGRVAALPATPRRGVFAATRSLCEELSAKGFRNVVAWSRGVDLERFTPAEPDPFPGLRRPVFLYAGRVAVEKNIEAFLSLDLPGSKVVVGDGPQRAALQRRFPEVHFTGYRTGRALAAAYAGADVFVFPSRTDTFGLSAAGGAGLWHTGGRLSTCRRST